MNNCKCSNCSKEFFSKPSQIKRGGGKFCSRLCKQLSERKRIDRTCIECEKEFWIHLGRLRRDKNEGRFCSIKCARRGENNPNYKGKDTWISVERKCLNCKKVFKTLDRTQNLCSNECRRKYCVGVKSAGWGGGIVYKHGYRFIYRPDHPNALDGVYMAEHRLVVEKRIGRYLKNEEHIHHINHDKLDNRSENLIIVSAGEHTRLHNLGRKWAGDRQKQSERMIKIRSERFWSSKTI